MCDKGAGHNAPHFKILMQDNSCYDIILIVCESFCRDFSRSYK